MWSDLAALTPPLVVCVAGPAPSSPALIDLENPNRQLRPMPPLRRPVTNAKVSESPVGALKLSFTEMLCDSGVPRAEPRFPGQQGGVPQFVPPVVPSTNVV